MAGNSFGQAFRVTTAGESHGPGNVVIIDGCPPGLTLDTEELMVDLMYQLPDEPKGSKYVITEEVVEGNAELFNVGDKKKKESA